MAQSAPVTQNTGLLENIFQLENEIASLLGKEVLDYVFLFTNQVPLQIEFEELTPHAKEILKEYVLAVENLFNKLGVPTNYRKQKSLQQAFRNAMQDSYLFRFVQARKEYAEYQLVRVPTEIERRIMESIDGLADDKFLPSVITFALPEAFVIDNFGQIDIKATAEIEKKEHQIKSYLSIVTMIDELSYILLNNFEDITIFGMVPRLLRQELLEINEELIQTVAMYFTRQCYAYLNRGLSPAQAKENVKAYYAKATKGTSVKFPPAMGDLEKLIEPIITDGINNLPRLYPQTKTALMEEYKELVLFMINSGYFIPENLYELIFRTQEQFDKYEKRFNYLIDVYLILDDNTKLPQPMETYNVDFTQEAKMEIFEAVTNGLENPVFNLSDYLAEEN